MENLIGRKVKGFKFESQKGCYFINNMDNFINKVGEIADVAESTALIDFDSEQGHYYYYYPLSEIEKHLVDENEIEVKDAEIVKETHFDKVIKNTFNHIENLLIVKGKEYQRNGNVFHNFDSGANITGQTPERILNGFLLKHLISYNDMLNDIEIGKNPSEALVEEKFNDIITYFAIQKAQILKRIK